MPVSSPSYFPPNSSSDQITGINAGRLATGAPHFLAGANAGNNSLANDLIIIGDNAGIAGIPVGLSGTIIIGDKSAPVLNSDSAVGSPNALTIIGTSSCLLLTQADSSIFLGSGMFPRFAGSISRSVHIGNAIASAMGGSPPLDNNVVIGFGAMNLDTISSTTGWTGNVIIGSQAMSVTTGCTSNVVLGFGAGASITGCSGNVIIGQGASSFGSGSNNVIIGIGTLTTQAIASNVIIGGSCTVTAGLGNHVIIGHGATVGASATNIRSVSIGDGAGRTIPNTLTNILCIETNAVGDAQHALIYGAFLTGNVIIGNSVDGTNRDFGGVPGTNMLKLLNGTAATGTNVTNGGYFTVLGGVLSWVDQNGIVTQLSNTSSGQLDGAATVPYTNNAGAQLATTTNGPLAGNPTKWIPINDNGTIRNIPAW